jgi:hypothetical protein
VLAAVAGAVGIGALLFLFDPPFATHPFLGPWLALVAAGATAAACVTAAVRYAAGNRPGGRRPA